MWSPALWIHLARDIDAFSDPFPSSTFNVLLTVSVGIFLSITPPPFIMTFPLNVNTEHLCDRLLVGADIC